MAFKDYQHNPGPDGLYSDKNYREWIQRQPSCISGEYSEYVDGEGRCIAAHVRRAKNSGIGMKPEFSCVPLTDAEHRLQHQHGETYLAPKAWWDEQVEIYRQRYEETWRPLGDCLKNVIKSLRGSQ